MSPRRAFHRFLALGRSERLDTELDGEIAAHLELAHIVLVLPLGLLFGWLRWRTGSLVPSIVAHVVNNSFAVLASSLIATD